jgi:hypothetical protein
MSTGFLPWKGGGGGGKVGQCAGMTTLSFSCANRVKILGASTALSPEGLSRPVQGLLYLLHYHTTF